MRNKWENDFLRIAEIIAGHSTCIRKKVGSILVRDGRILSIGYNGTVSGDKHCEDIFCNWQADDNFFKKHGEFSRIYEIHSEQNCIGYCAKNGINTNGASLFVTISPCNDCSKLLYICGIKQIFFDELYDRETDGLKFLKMHDVNLFKFNGDKFTEFLP